jgi:UDP-2-acetamido-2,6-beta-L-arabino-hexul-4-ose reductase
MKKRVGITGSKGFLAFHLLLRLHIDLKEEVEIVHFERSFIDNDKNLDRFIKNCDTIVHLAAINRHSDNEYLLNRNIEITRKIVESLERVNFLGDLVFISSSQENEDNHYGKSKKYSRRLLEQFFNLSNGKLYILKPCNIFGAFINPNYNSVFATFCYNLNHGIPCKIINDKRVKFIYIDNVINSIIEVIKNRDEGVSEEKFDFELKISELLEKLLFIHQKILKDEIPSLEPQNNLNIYNTLRSYLDFERFYPRQLICHSDNRGDFFEILRSNSSGQFSFSTTNPGVTRGNHFHTRKVERFIVIQGKALIELYSIKTKDKIKFIVEGSNPAFIEIPIYHSHRITNIGQGILRTAFWINEHYNPNNSDTILYEFD